MRNRIQRFWRMQILLKCDWSFCELNLKNFKYKTVFGILSSILSSCKLISSFWIRIQIRNTDFYTTKDARSTYKIRFFIVPSFHRNRYHGTVPVPGTGIQYEVLVLLVPISSTSLSWSRSHNRAFLRQILYRYWILEFIQFRETDSTAYCGVSLFLSRPVFLRPDCAFCRVAVTVHNVLV
jgi:hypothetical protein